MTNFGMLVKELRKNSTDNWGKPLSREDLSRRVHLTPEQLGRLERGERKYVDPEDLKLLADAFNLTSLERKEFYFAALGLTDEHVLPADDPDSKLNHAISTLANLKTPGYIIDVYADIIAANEGVIKLYRFSEETVDHLRQIPAGMNLLHLIYSSSLGMQEFLGSCWQESARMALLEFRRSTLRYRHTDYFKQLLSHLVKEKQFSIDWYASQRYEENYDFTYENFTFTHPEYGPLSYLATETTIHTKKGELYLIMYNPGDEETKKTFDKMISLREQEVTRLAPWPEKGEEFL